MPRTRAQRRATQGLFVLGDDALRNVLTFLSPSVCALGPGATSRALRELTTSRQLQVARKSGSYTLRPPDNGVVHALATAFGTREWPTRAPERDWGGHPRPGIRLCVPPPPLRVRVHRVGSPNQGELDLRDEGAMEYNRNFDAALVSRLSVSSALNAESPDCSLKSGSFIEYELPFQLRITDFRIAFGNCCAREFDDWLFQRYDRGIGDWICCHYCSVSPWEDILGPGEHGYQGARPGPEKIINVEDNGLEDGIVSNRFRIELCGTQCMHVRAFELFGTILPRSNPDPAPPSPEEAAVHTTGLDPGPGDY